MNLLNLLALVSALETDWHTMVGSACQRGCSVFRPVDALSGEEPVAVKGKLLGAEASRRERLS